MELLRLGEFDFDCPDGNKLINWACKNGKTEVIQILMPVLKQGKVKDINDETFTPDWFDGHCCGPIAIDMTRLNPLAHACLNDHLDIAELLIKNAESIRIDLSHQYCDQGGDEKGTIVTLACENSKPDVLKLLFEAAKACSYKFINASDLESAFDDEKDYKAIEMVNLCLEYAEELKLDLNSIARSDNSDSEDEERFDWNKLVREEHSMDSKLKSAIEDDDIERVKETLNDQRQHLINFEQHYISAISKENLDIFILLMEHVEWKADLSQWKSELTSHFEKACKSGNFDVVKLLCNQLVKEQDVIDKQRLDLLIDDIATGKLYKYPKIATFLIDIAFELKMGHVIHVIANAFPIRMAIYRLLPDEVRARINHPNYNFTFNDFIELLEAENYGVIVDCLTENNWYKPKSSFFKGASPNQLKSGLKIMVESGKVLELTKPFELACQRKTAK